MSETALKEITNAAAQAQAEADSASSNPASEAQESSAPSPGEPSQIPEKFIGKSNLEIIEMYRNLESHNGKVSSEKAQKEKELEELRQRQLQLEQQYQIQSQQSQVNHQPQGHVDQDPLSEFDKKFEEDPKAAIRETFKAQFQTAQQVREQIQLQAQAQLQVQRYEQLKKENPDFAELEPEMVKIANRLAPALHPSFRNSPEAIEYMYDIARGKNLSKYVEKGITAARAQGQLVREEKRNAFSESSSSESSEKTRSFGDLSLKEMEALLGKADK